MRAKRVRQTIATMPAPLERVDLGRWLRGVTSEEYVGFTPRSGAHKSHTVVSSADGFTFDAVESIGGTMLEHRYTAEVLEPHRILCVSRASRGRFLGVAPVRFATTWDVRAAASGAATELTCRVEVEFRNRFWLFLSALSGAGLWLARHSKEETPRMAQSIAADATRRG